MTQRFCFPLVSCLPQFRCTSLECSVGWIYPSSLSTGVGWSKRRLNKFVQFIEIHIGEQRAQNSPLRAATVCSVIAPLLQVSSFEEPFDEPEKSAIVDFLAQD